MKRFSYEEYRNQVCAENAGFEETLEEFVKYVLHEKKKGKIPLIIVGAGASANSVEVKDGTGSAKTLENGLPCLSSMIWKLCEMVRERQQTDDNPELRELYGLFEPVDRSMKSIDRERLGKIFALLEKSQNPKVRKLWKDYCDWFFFDCIQSDEGDQL